MFVATANKIHDDRIDAVLFQVVAGDAEDTLQIATQSWGYGKFAPVHVHTDVIESTLETRNAHGHYRK